MQFFVFSLATIIVLGGALGVVLASNPVHSALSLVASLAGMAVFFLQLDAQLVAAVQIIVYASAIVVLFLFVIMLLGVDRRERITDIRRPQTIAALVLGVLVLVLVLVIGRGNWTTGAPSANGALSDRASVSTTAAPTPEEQAARRADPGNIETVAEAIFTDFAWPLELTAVLLTLAVVGAVILAKRTVGGPVLEVYDAEGEPEDAAAREETPT